MRVKNLCVFLLLGLLLSGCGYTTKRIAANPQYWNQAFQEGYRKGYQEGTLAGSQACIRKIRKAIEQDIDLLSSIRRYQKLVRSGVLAPPRIALIKKSSSIRGDGRVYEGSTYKVVIVQPPRFVKKSFLDRILNPEQFYAVGLFADRIKAEAFAQRLRKDAVSEPDEVWVIPAEPAIDKRFAVVIRSVSGKDYSLIGMPEAAPRGTTSQQLEQELQQRVPPYNDVR